MTTLFRFFFSHFFYQWDQLLENKMTAQLQFSFRSLVWPFRIAFAIELLFITISVFCFFFLILSKLSTLSKPLYSKELICGAQIRRYYAITFKIG